MQGIPPPTYYKGPGNTQVPNVRAADGSMTDDTVVSTNDGTTPATYYPNYSGTWSSDSDYEWSGAPEYIGSTICSGVFNSSAPFGNITIPDYQAIYTNSGAADGTCDVWPANGYAGNFPWTGHKPDIDPGSNAGISWTTYDTLPGTN